MGLLREGLFAATQRTRPGPSPLNRALDTQQILHVIPAGAGFCD